jgi:epoxide hydrolase
MTETITPFRIDVPQAAVEDLDARLAGARWPDELPGVGRSRGIPLTELRDLADHWRTGFDWRAAEAHLNAYPQFTTEIDGQTIHFLHLRCGRPGALTLVLTHGFPSSVAEFLGLVDRLTHPAAGPAFDLVVPSLPGYAFSTPLAATGWTMARTARAWVELMRRLGIERYGVHGGDIGGGIAGNAASLDPDHVVGMHIVTDPITAASVATFMPRMADRLSDDDPVDQLIRERMTAFRTDGSGYLAIQNSRPQTIGYGLVDSPVLQLAWVAEKVHDWTDLPVDRDQLLTTVSLYWFTRSGASAAHTLYEQAHSSEWGGPVTVPQAFAVFGADETARRLVPVPDGTRWTEFPRGQHFPAMEAPAELGADLQAFFGPLA